MATDIGKPSYETRKNHSHWRLWLWALLLLTPLPARCQLEPGEVSVNYAQLRANSSGTGGAFDAKGLNVSIAWNANPRLSFVVDAGGHHFQNQGPGVDAKLLTFTGGPRLSWPRERNRWIPFAQVLLGVGRVRATSSTQTAAENGFVMLAGGGVNSRLWTHLEVRVVEVDYLLTRFARVTGSPGIQNDIRVSTGLVLRFGRRY